MQCNYDLQISSLSRPSATILKRNNQGFCDRPTDDRGFHFGANVVVLLAAAEVREFKDMIHEEREMGLSAMAST